MSIQLLMPSSDGDKNRWESTRTKRRILADKHRQDLVEYFGKHMDPSRQDAWGPPTIALNVFRSVISQLAVLYDKPPTITNTIELSPDQATYINALRPFRLGQRHQQNVLGLRESLYRISWAPATTASPGGIELRLVTPDQVVIKASQAAPEVPLIVEESVIRCSRLSEGKKQKEEAVWDVWDISDPENPSFRICRVAKGCLVDVTSEFVEPAAYPFRDQNGTPFLPFVLYHAASHGRIWDEFQWDALIQASFDMALLATFWIHVVKNASWAQKYGVDVELQGLSNKAGMQGESRQRVGTDPSSIILFRKIAGAQSGTVGVLQQASDPKGVIASIANYMAMCLDSSGFSSSDVEITAAQSGVAIQIRRDALRRIQAQFEPLFAQSDSELLSKIAMISNLFKEDQYPPLPEKGWVVQYAGLPFSREEETERLTAWKERIDLGLASKVDYLMAEKGMDRPQAIAYLTQIQTENRQFAV